MSNQSELLQDVIAKIEAAVDTDDVEYVEMDCMEELEAAGVGQEAIVPLLGIFERHPVSDFGIPGDIMHFVEAFDDNVYFPFLLESFARRPSVTTVWAMNGILNVTKKPQERQHMLGPMEAALTREDVESVVKEQIQDVLDYQSGK